VLLDTNILVRHLTGSPPDQARRATEFLASPRQLWLVDLVVAETVYVLRSVYGVRPAEVAELLRTVLAHPTISVANARVLLRSLDLLESVRLNYAEAYLVALAEASGIRTIASFDRALDRVGTVERLEP
jgi:predicted nucleic acid-binding protein